MKSARLISMLALAAISLPAAAQTAGQWQKPEHIWRAVCSYCHGANVAAELRGRGLPVELIFTIVRQGVPGMPVFHPSEISDDELADLSIWLSSSAAPGTKP